MVCTSSSQTGTEESTFSAGCGMTGSESEEDTVGDGGAWCTFLLMRKVGDSTLCKIRVKRCDIHHDIEIRFCE